jgi:TonB-dependent receptor
MSSKFQRFLIIILLLGLAAVASAQTGSIAGRVVDQSTRAALPGAAIIVDGTSLSTVTDRDGHFRLSGVAAGPVTLVVSYIGRADTRLSVTANTSTTEVVVEVDGRGEDSSRYQESVVVSAPLLADAQARALNQQKNASNIANIVSADQIGSFPDPNAAEATQRIPGVSIQRDQGEGRYVIIRGTEPRLNSTMVNGERLPAPEANVRQVALDVIPADLLQSIEVSKTLTPDMDGDAIGGSVNLVTKNAPERFRAFGSIGTGYNSSLSSYDQHSLMGTTGSRFAGGKAGIIVSASSTGTERGNEDFEPVYTAGNLADLDLRSYVVTRRRNGSTAAMDIHPNADTQLNVRGIYNYYIDDREERQRMRNRVANRRLERELRDRTHTEHIWSISADGARNFNRGTIDFRVSTARADQDDPLTIATTFRQSNVNFLPNVTPASIDPDNVQAAPQNESIDAYTFNQQTRATNFAGERDLVGAVNFRFNAASSQGLTAFIKAGAKFRDKTKERTRDEFTLTSATTIPMSAVFGGAAGNHSLLDGRYAFGPYLDPDLARDLVDRYNLTSVANHARDTEDFDVSEQVASGYVMAELFAGARVSIIPGVRVEHTAADYTGHEVLFSPAGAWLETRPITGARDYTTVLPGINVKFAATPSTNLRVAVTRSLARPNYFDLVPYRAFNDSDNTIANGNPALEPTLSWNADALVERYFSSIGVISAGVFYKKLEDYIYVFTSRQQVNGETFTVTQPLNGESASIRGVELAAQSQLGFLPSPLDGFGVYLNYTFTDSTAEFPGRIGEAATLPGQSRHVGNVATFYEKFGFATRLSVNFHGSYVDQVAAETGLDRFYDTHTQVDFSISQRFARKFRAYFNALNLSDAPLRYFQGVNTRPLQEEHYRAWYEFGVKVDW